MLAQKSILMLGGSQQQVVAIEKAKELGFRTVLCDYLPDNPGQYSADAFYLVSTTDREAVLEVAKSEGVSGVLAYSSDPASPTAAYVAEELGLPTNPLAAVETMSEKHRFRTFMQDAGLPCPKSISFPVDEEPAELAQRLFELQLPIVIKPTDSSGSKGVSVLHNVCLSTLTEAMSLAAEHSRNGILIAEEYIERTFSNVIGGDIFVYEGHVQFWGLMSCLRDQKGNNLVPVGKKTPSGLSDKQTESVKATLSSLVSALGLKFGELNVEVILGKNGKPYVLELGSRAGGNMIPVQLSDVSGIDLVAANVLCAMGENPGPLNWESRGECCATYVLHSNIDGVYEGIALSNTIEPHVYRLVQYLAAGATVHAFDGANRALGIAFLRFDDERQMDAILNNIDEHICVKVAESNA